MLANLVQCADIMFNSTAELLSDEQCQNSTGVSASAIENAGSGSETEEESPSGTAGGDSPAETGAASHLSPMVGTGLFAAALAWGLL